MRWYWIIAFLCSVSLLFSGDVTSTSGIIHFDPQNDGVSDMVLNSTGLSIGSSSPNCQLKVCGNAMITGDLVIGAQNSAGSNLHINGSMSWTPQTLSDNSSLANISLALANSNLGNLILSLPNSSSSSNIHGQILQVKKISSSNKVIITGAMIDHYSSIVLESTSTYPYPSIELLNNQGAYYITSISGNIDYGVSSDNLALWWPLDSISGGITHDVSHMGRHGYVMPNTNVTGQLGNSLYLNGIDNYVEIISDAATNLTGYFSLSAWVKRANTGSMMLLSKKNDWNLAGGYELELQNNYLRFLGGSTDVWADSNQSITWGNTWQHLVFVCETIGVKSYIKFYHNAVDISSGANTTDAVTASSIAMHIGNRTVDNSKDFTGELDELRIFNTALSPSEVGQLYGLSTSVASSNLTAHYSFDSLSGNVVPLAGGSGQAGTLVPNPGSFTGLVGGPLDQAMNFDGVDDAVEISSIGISGNTTPRTIMAWVKVSTWTNDAGIWHTGYPSNNVDFSLELSSAPGTITLNTWGNDQNFNLTGASSDWHHITAVFDGTTNTVYVNGTSQLSYACSYGSGFADNGISIGKPRAAGQGGAYFHGQIDDVRVYNKALSSNEIFHIYNLGL
jgi:hypothetical protein